MMQGRTELRQMTWRVGTVGAFLVVAAMAADGQVVFSRPVNASNSAGNSQLPQIAVDERGNINMVWLDDSPGNFSVFFSKSSDGGVTFSSPMNLSSSPGGAARFPQIAVDFNARIYVAWFDSNSGNPSIFLRRSTDGGATFSTAITAPAVQWPVLMTIDGSNDIDLVWAADDTIGVPQVVFSRSVDGGTTFSVPLTISNSSAGVNASSPAGTGPGSLALGPNGNIDVVWTESAPPQGTNDVMFSRSTDGGATFSAPGKVTSSLSPTFGVAGLAVDGAGNIQVLWMSSQGGVNDAFLSRSHDGGATFAAENFQSGVSDATPSPQLALDLSGGVNLLWNSGDQNPTLNFSRSSDGGATFVTQRLAGGDYSYPGSAAIVTDTSGNIEVLWSQGGGPSAPRGLMFTRSTDSARTFSARQQIAGAVGQNVTAVVDSGGNIYTAWSQLVSTGNGDIFLSRGTVPSLTTVYLTSLRLGSSNVTGGNSTVSTVTLSGAAPAGGTIVSFASGNPSVASVPGFVTIPAGKRKGTFNLVTNAVASSTPVSIAASFSGVTQMVTLTVVPPALASLELNPPNVTGGGSSTGTITLTGPASRAGVVIALKSGNPAVAGIPASVTVPAGSTRATFGMKTRMVLCPNQVTISARFNDVNLTADLGVGSPFSLPKAACGGTGSRHRMHSSRCVLPGCADLPWLAAPLPAFS